MFVEYFIKYNSFPGKLIETEEPQDDTDGEKGTSNIKVQKCEIKESEGPTITLLKQTSTGEILVKRNFVDTSDTIHVRKTIRLSSDNENRSVMQIKPEFVKKSDNENQILIPIKFHTSDLVKDIQNTLIVNKSKNFSDKKYGVHNQNVSSVNCVRQNVSESDGNSFIKMRRLNKVEDVVTESNKKFKRSEC